MFSTRFVRGAQIKLRVTMLAHDMIIVSRRKTNKKTFIIKDKMNRRKTDFSSNFFSFLCVYYLLKIDSHKTRIITQNVLRA